MSVIIALHNLILANDYPVKSADWLTKKVCKSWFCCHDFQGQILTLVNTKRLCQCHAAVYHSTWLCNKNVSSKLITVPDISTCNSYLYRISIITISKFEFQSVVPVTGPSGLKKRALWQMVITPEDFAYLSRCVEGFLFGTISCSTTLITKLLKQSDITPSQEFILAYLLCIYNTIPPEKTPAKGTISFSMLSVFYIFYLSLSTFWIFWFR